MSRIEVSLEVTRRDVRLDLDVAGGEVLAVLGPNGAGKSTLLEVLAGAVRPDRGHVRVGDRTLTDCAAGKQIATHDRRIGLLMQDALLFPHLSVLDNVAFSPRSGKRLSRKDSRNIAETWLAEVGAGDLVDRMPGQLSGGQAQRVALARALAAEPDVLLLDEPMAGLDISVATAMRATLRRVLTRDGRAAILVTHDLLDVVTLADQVAVLEAGRVVEHGPATQILAVPRSTFGARFAGVNLVNGRWEDGALRTEWGTQWYGSPQSDIATGAPVVAVFAPAAVAVYRDAPHGSPRNAVQVTVAELDSRGPAIRVRAEAQPDGAPGLAADITADAAAELRLAPGERIFFTVKAQELTIQPAS
ncbi:MAG: ATP-binding cassette domain-containing protein [Mycolicibacterium cosmeticum]|nr:ATP-binding cassette domain-containing protein [Mycolicibacterium cosmeticum]